MGLSNSMTQQTVFPYLGKRAHVFFSLQNVLCRVAIDQSLQVLSLRKDRDGHSAISFSDAT